MAAAAAALLRLLAFLFLLRLLVLLVAPAAAARPPPPAPAPAHQGGHRDAEAIATRTPALVPTAAEGPGAAASHHLQLREFQVKTYRVAKKQRQPPSGPSPTRNTVGLAGTTGKVEVGRVARHRRRHRDKPASSAEASRDRR